mmetsp:Transcript_18683/g.62975  ORF Transcript_18683/g.62975 Transcript_18683/m.62975 type:complete len:440 (-) Transcript_18683:117-1436(-)
MGALSICRDRPSFVAAIAAAAHALVGAVGALRPEAPDATRGSRRALSLLRGCAERGGVLEEAEPRRRRVRLPLWRRPRTLPLDEAALRVRHHGEVAPVGRAEGSDALGGAVGVVRVLLRHLAGVVDVPERSLRTLEHGLQRVVAREMRAPLAMGDPHAQARALHALEEDGGGRCDLDGAPARLEPARRVVHEARLLRLRDGVAAGHPAKQRHQLAAVADAEREGVGPVAEGLELRREPLVELDRRGPALGRVEHVRVRETAAKDDAAEGVERHGAAGEVGHGHVPRRASRRVQRRRHLAVAVRALLPEDRHARPPVLSGQRRGRRSEGETPLRRVPLGEAGLLLGDAGGRALQLLELERARLPRIAQLAQAGAEHLGSADRDLHGRAARLHRADPRARHARRSVGCEDGRLVRRRDLEEETNLFGEEGGEGRRAGRRQL